MIVSFFVHSSGHHAYLYFKVVMTFMGGWYYSSETFAVSLNVYSYQVLGSTHGLHVWHYDLPYRTADFGAASGQ